MSRNRAWCFTINNYSASDWFAVKHLFNKSAAYGICGEEIAPTTGTKHLQGYVHLKNALSMKAMSKCLGRARLIPSNGSDDDNKVYCSKGENIYEIGTPSVGQGSRTDILELSKLINNRLVTMEIVMFQFPELYCRYSSSISKMFAAVYRPRTQSPEVHWRWGLAGTGKSRFAMEAHETFYVKDNTKWWDNYMQQKAIVIDDFDNAIPFRTLLRLLDRYPYQGEVKNGYINVDSPFIYITCEFPPEHYWYGNDLAQISRRLTSVQEIKKSLEVVYNGIQEESVQATGEANIQEKDG